MALKSLPLHEYLSSGHRLCAGCGEGVTIRQILKAFDEPPIICNATSCLEVSTTPFPYTAWRTPWIHPAFECTGAVVAGVEAAQKALIRKGRKKKWDVVLALAGDGGTHDIGLQALSGALERGHKFVYVCYTNDAYMNTGIQRSGATPKAAWTTTSPAGKVIPGKTEWQKDLMKIVVAHDIPYAATASPSYPMDLQRKMKKATQADGPAFILALAPCPRGWRTPPHLTIELGRLAVQTCMFPLYEVEKGQYRITMKPKRKLPVEYYLRPQGRFRHLFTPKTRHDIINDIQAYVDKKWQELQRMEQLTQP